MKNNHYILILLLIGTFLFTITNSTQAQTPWRAKLFVHFLDSNNKIVTDTVWFGCDSLGDIGYQQGLDIFDTAVTQNKVLGFDSLVQIQYKTGCANLKQNVKQLKKGVTDFTFYAFGRVVAMSWDKLDFLYNPDTLHWLTFAYLISKNSYLRVFDNNEADICYLVGTTLKFALYDSIRAFGEGMLPLECNYQSKITHLRLLVNFGYYDSSIGLKKSSLNGADIYPNPVNRILHVSFNKLFSGVLQVITPLGFQVMSQDINASDYSEIDLSSLSNGLYYINFTDKKNQVVHCQKIIIQH